MKKFEFAGRPTLFAALCLAGAATLHVTPANAGDQSVTYVALSGNDTGNTCAFSSSPCRTIGQAYNQSKAGGEIICLGPIGGTGTIVIQKSLRIAESKTVTFRMDATNVFKHPTPENPNLNINSGTFGEISSKTGNRTVQAQVRFDF